MPQKAKERKTSMVKRRLLMGSFTLLMLILGFALIPARVAHAMASTRHRASVPATSKRAVASCV